MHSNMVLVAKPCVGGLYTLFKLVVGDGLESAIDSTIDRIDGLENNTHL